jgi:hypothetical protein
VRRRFRKLLGILTGSRRRRWRRALAIHESHKWDAKERLAREVVQYWRRRILECANDEAINAYGRSLRALDFVRLDRLFYGTTWLGPRPSAP